MDMQFIKFIKDFGRPTKPLPMIPTDILIEILVKLPVKPLVRFTAVCKAWQSLIRSSLFTTYHLSYHKNQNPRLLLSHSDKPTTVTGLCAVLNIDDEGRSFSTYYSSELPSSSKPGYVRIVGSYNGIICLLDHIIVDGISIKSVALWNPCVGKHIVLPEPIVEPKKISLGVWGFHHDYNVLRLVDFLGTDVLPRAEIYSMKLGRWRKLNGFDGGLRISSCKHAYVNGVVHWITMGITTQNAILSFNVHLEVFDEATLKLPDELVDENVDMFEVGLIGESLAVFHWGFDLCGVWVMKDYGVKESWTKLYSICMSDNQIYRLIGGFHKNGEALIALLQHKPSTITKEVGYELVSYNSSTMMAKYVEVKGRVVYGRLPSDITFADYYRESLLLF